MELAKRQAQDLVEQTVKSRDGLTSTAFDLSQRQQLVRAFDVKLQRCKINFMEKESFYQIV